MTYFYNKDMTQDMPKVLLVGPGGVGSVVALGIDYTGKADLSIVVRRDYPKVSKDGYEFKSIDYGHVTHWKPHNIFPNIEEAILPDNEYYDFVIITTKSLPDIVKMEDVIEKVITPRKTTIVLIQNGFGIERPFLKKYPKNICLSGVSHIGSHNFNGVIHQTQHDRCFISCFFNEAIPLDIQKLKAEEFITLYSNAKNAVSYYPDVKKYRYMKLVYNAAMNTTCALTRVDTGRLEVAGTNDSICVPAMHEVIEVAEKDGVKLPEGTINKVIHSDDGDWYEPSMLIDVKKGNPIELEVILGNLLIRAGELDVQTPTLTLLYNLLKAVQLKLREGKGQVKLPENRPITDKYYS